MTAFDSGAQEEVLLFLDEKAAKQPFKGSGTPITHFDVAGWPSKPNDLRVVLRLSTESGIQPVNPTIVFAMSVAAAQKIFDKLRLAIEQADKKK
jgi:hypothetical protein